MAKPEAIADNEIPGPEPEGFWEPVHVEVRRMSKSALASEPLGLIDDDD